MTLVQPYPISDAGTAGLQTSVLSPLAGRAAVLDYCRKLERGYFHLKKVSTRQKTTLWTVTWPMPLVRDSRGVRRHWQMAQTWKFVTEE
jgi:hypothetical protein